MSDTGGTFDVKIDLGVALTAVNSLGPEIAKLIKRDVKRALKGLDLGVELGNAINKALDGALGRTASGITRLVNKTLASGANVTVIKKAGATLGKSFAVGFEATATKDGVAAIKAASTAIGRAAAAEARKAEAALARQRNANRTRVTLARAPGRNALDKAAAEARKAEARRDAAIAVDAAKTRNRQTLIEQNKAARIEANNRRAALRINEQTESASNARALARTRRHTRLLTIGAIAGVDAIRDLRRIRSREQLAADATDQRNQDRALRAQTLRLRAQNRTQLIEARNFARQRGSALAQIEARTAGGVLGALRGTSFIGGALRNVFFAGGGALLLGKLVDQAEDFNASLQFLQGLTGATSAQMTQLSKKAIQLGKDITLPGTSATDAADALSQLVRAGLSVEQAMGSARGALILARTQSVDFGRAAKFVGAQLNLFNFTAAQTGSAIDSVVQSIREGGGQTFGELETALRQAGSQASNFVNAIDATGKIRDGLGTFADLNAALAVLARNGLRGSIAGTALQNFLLHILNPTAKATKVFGAAAQEIGALSDDIKSFTTNADGTLKTLPQVITGFQQFFSQFQPSKRQELLGQLFGTRAIKAANVFSNLDLTELERLSGLEVRAANLADRLAEAINRGPRAALEAVTSVVESLFTQGFNLVRLPLSRGIFQLATAVDQLFTGTQFTQVRGALLGIGGGLASIAAGRGGVQILGALKSVVIGLASPMGVLSLAASTLGATISLGIRNSEAFKDSMIGLTDTISGVLLPAFGRFVIAFQGLFSGADAASGGRSFFDAAAITIASRFIPGVRLAALAIDQTLIPSLNNVPSFVRNELIPVVESLPPIVSDVFALLVSEGQALARRIGFDKVFGDIQTAARIAMTGVRQVLAGDRVGAGATFSGLGSTIKTRVTEALRDIPFGRIFEQLVRGAARGIERAGQFITETLFSKPVLSAAVKIGAGAAVVALSFVKGLAKGILARRGDIAAVLGETLLAAAKIALGVAFSSPLASLVSTALLGVFAVKNFRKVADAITPLFALIRTRSLAGVEEELKAVQARRQAGYVAQLKDGDQFGRSLTARIARGARGLESTLIGIGQSGGQTFGASFAAAAAGALAGFTGGQLGGIGGGLLAGLTGGLGTLTLAASGVAAPLAALPLLLSGVGFALGQTSKQAREARERMKAFSDQLRADEPFIKAFADGIAALVDKDTGLGAALAGAGIGNQDVLRRLLNPSSVIRVASDLDKLRDRALQMNAGFAQTQGIVELRAGVQQLADSGTIGAAQLDLLNSELDRLTGAGNVESAAQALLDFDAALESVGTQLTGTKSGAQQFADLIKEVDKASREALQNDALSFAVDKASEALGKAIVVTGDFRTALSDIIPNNTEDVLTRQLGIPLGAIGTAVAGNRADLDVFIAQVRAAGEAAGLDGPQLDSLALTLNGVDRAAQGAAAAARRYALDQTRLKRETQLKKIESDWGAIEQATRDALSQLDIYFGKLSGDSSQVAEDQLLVTGKRALEGVAEFIKAHPNLNLINVITKGTGGIAGAEFRTGPLKEITDALSTFLETLPTEILKDPGKLSQAVSSALGELMRAGLADGIPQNLLQLLFNDPEFLGTLPKLSTAARQQIGLAKSAIVTALKEGLPGQDLASVLFGTNNPQVVIKALLDNSDIPEDVKEFLRNNPIEATAIITDILQPKTPPVVPAAISIDKKDVAGQVRAAVTLAFSTLPPLPVRVRVTNGPSVFESSEGRIATRPTLTTVAEGGRPEAIIPLTKPQRALKLLRASGLDRLITMGRMGSLKGAGQDIGAGAALGIAQSQGAVAAATAGLAATVANTFSRLLGIHSPSTVFIKFGRDIIDGLVKGLKEGAEAAGDSIARFVNIVLGRAPAGGGAASGIGQLQEAVRKSVADALREQGDALQTRSSAQSSALSGIAALIERDQLRNFRSGLDPTSAAGAANRQTIVDAVANAREAIVSDLEAGDTAAAQSVFDQLFKNLVKVSLQGNAATRASSSAAIGEILAAFGLGGSTPIADILAKFAAATEELNRTLAEANQRAAEQAASNVPQFVDNSETTVIALDPHLTARTLERERQRRLARNFR